MKARVAILGGGLMGHGIAQVFALAGHEVNITDTVVQNLDTVQSRIATNLRDLGDDESAAARVQLKAVRRFASSTASQPAPSTSRIGGFSVAWNP